MALGEGVIFIIETIPSSRISFKMLVFLLFSYSLNSFPVTKGKNIDVNEKSNANDENKGKTSLSFFYIGIFSPNKIVNQIIVFYHNAFRHSGCTRCKRMYASF